MPSTASGPAQNRLLAALPQGDRRRILASSRPVNLTPSEILNESKSRVRYAYFPLESSISISTQFGIDAPLDVGLIGNEGMLGIGLILGVQVSPQIAVVQGAGTALRMDSMPFRQELLVCPALARILKRYVHVVVDQLAQQATCTRFHQVEARLARLLLMTQDRAGEKPMHLTHKTLAGRLGVRRAGVSAAASALQRRALIDYHRGDVVILDRSGLKGAACSCYAADNGTYARVMAGGQIR